MRSVQVVNEQVVKPGGSGLMSSLCFAVQAWLGKDSRVLHDAQWLPGGPEATSLGTFQNRVQYSSSPHENVARYSMMGIKGSSLGYTRICIDFNQVRGASAEGYSSQ